MDMPSAFNWGFDLHIPRYTGTALSEFWFNFILMNVIFFIVYIYRNRMCPRNISWLLILVFCLYAFWDTDYFSFANVFYRGLNHFRDPIYKYISFFSFGSYLIFRFWIWGVGLWLVYNTAKRFGLEMNVLCYVFAIFFMLTFSYARVSLAMALYFFGLSFLIIRDRNIIERAIIVVLTFLCAYMAHRSILVLIAISPVACLKLTKRRVILIACFSPIIILGVKYILGAIIAGALAGSSSEFARSAQGYASSKISVAFNWKWELITTLRYWSFYVALLYILWVFFFKNRGKEHYYPSGVQALLTITCAIVLIAVTILSISGNKLLGLWVVGYRYLYMAGIPICLLLTYMYQNALVSEKTLNRILLLPFLYAELFILGKIITLQFIK